MSFSVAVAMATVKPEGLAPQKTYFFKTVIILNYHVKFQVDITNIKEKVSAHRCLALSLVLADVCGRPGKDFPLGLTQDIKMGSCVFQCDVPHQLIAQRQVGPVSVYCNGMGCLVLCLQHGIPVWPVIGQSTTATSRHRRDMTSDV